jgi:hypothetical protein
MTRKFIECSQIAALFAVVFAGAISDTRAQSIEGGPLVVVEDCGKTAVFVCGMSGQRMGGPPRRMGAVHVRRSRHVQYSSDQRTPDLQWLWNDP